jgi:PAS domain S-box-containing protein
VDFACTSGFNTKDIMNTDQFTIYESFFRSSLEGIFILNDRFMIKGCNPAALRFVDYPEAELTTMPLKQIIEDGCWSDVEALYKRVVAGTEGSNVIEGGFVKKDGRKFTAEIKAYNHVRDPNGPVVILSFIDITERKESQEQLKRLNLELEEKVKERTRELIEALEHEKMANELKSRFVSMASHEFRTPLSTLFSSVDILEQYIKPAKDSKEKKHFVRIRSSVNHMTEILNDFLSLDRLENGGIRPEPVMFNMNDYAGAIVAQFKGILRKGQVIEYLYEGDELVYHDKKIIRNILFNLLSNASKYSGENKSIGLKVVMSDHSIRLEISDQGIGIPDDEQALMFTRLFRARNAANISGTGLGLNIVKKYLDLLRGSISFSSVKDKGTTFNVALPRNFLD